MANWKAMSSAPIEGRIDIWAKRWVAKTDQFEFRRFCECFWRGTYFAGVPKDWHPTHWLPAPEPPTDEQLMDINTPPSTEHRRRWEPAEVA